MTGTPVIRVLPVKDQVLSDSMSLQLLCARVYLLGDGSVQQQCSVNEYLVARISPSASFLVQKPEGGRKLLPAPSKPHCVQIVGRKEPQLVSFVEVEQGSRHADGNVVRWGESPGLEIAFGSNLSCFLAGESAAAFGKSLTLLALQLCACHLGSSVVGTEGSPENGRWLEAAGIREAGLGAGVERRYALQVNQPEPRRVIPNPVRFRSLSQERLGEQPGRSICTVRFLL